MPGPLLTLDVAVHNAVNGLLDLRARDGEPAQFHIRQIFDLPGTDGAHTAAIVPNRELEAMLPTDATERQRVLADACGHFEHTGSAPEPDFPGVPTGWAAAAADPAAGTFTVTAVWPGNARVLTRHRSGLVDYREHRREDGPMLADGSSLIGVLLRLTAVSAS